MLSGRTMTVDFREFALVEWDGVNRSGWQALDDKVLVLMEEHVEKTSGGIVIPDESRDRQTLSSEHGVLISIGPGAFQFGDGGGRWTGKRPEPGDRIAVERYSGQLVSGIDGRKYRLMSQRCVGAVAIVEAHTSSELGHG